MSDSSIIQSMQRSAAAAERQAAQYRRAGRDDDADAAAKDAKRWRQAASGTPQIWAEADRIAAAMAVEHVDYAEAEAVRQIEEEMALEAAGVERWEDL